MPARLRLDGCGSAGAETFLRAYRHLHAYDLRRAPFPTWLLTIARRLALNALAHGRRREISESAEPVADPPTAGT